MPYTAKTHEENRQKVCAVCFKKSARPLNDKQKWFILNNLYARFKEQEHILPSGICNGCRMILSSREGAKPRPLPLRYNYEGLVQDLSNMPPLTRTHPSCTCEVCRVARAQFPQLGPQHQVGSSRPPVNLPSQDTATVLCSHCLSEVGKGKAHVCSKTTRLANIDNVFSPRTKDHITSSTLRQKLQEAQRSSVTLATGGAPMTVSVGGGARRKLDFSLPHSSMIQMQSALNLSDRQTLEAAKIVREGIGSKTAVQSNLKPALSIHGRSLESFFSCETLTFTCRQEQGKSEQIKRPTVLCSDVSLLVQFICEKRATSDNVFKKIGLDGGGGSLKVCLNLIDTNFHPRSPTQSPAAKKLSTGKFLDTGVKKLIIIGITFDVQELYENVRTLLRSLKIDRIHFAIATDLKLANILVGIQSHSSKHPCTWCEGSLPWSSPGRPRTLGRIKELVQAFRNAGGQLPKAATFMNCVNDPIIEGDNSWSILEFIPPPELHLMLGVVNRIFDELDKIWGENRAFKFAAEQNITRVGYRGGSMEGNQCKMLLNKLSLLEEVLPPQLLKFVNALKAFNLVRNACFGEQLSPNFMTLVQEFKGTYLALGIAVTPKVHAIFDHVPEFCNLKKVGLGMFSEQASESVHADFKHTWQRFAVPLTHHNFGSHLLQAVTKYNSMHL
jgi:hypothetical protein